MDEIGMLTREVANAWATVLSSVNSGVLVVSCAVAIALSFFWIVYSQVKERYIYGSARFRGLATAVLLVAGVVLAFSVLHPRVPATGASLDGVWQPVVVFVVLVIGWAVWANVRLTARRRRDALEYGDR